MSFAAEPYGVFVEDLLANLTGGVSRVAFRFVPEAMPFELHERVRPDSVRVHGLVDGEFTLFAAGLDYVVGDDAVVVWRESEPGVPAAEARWPDEGTDFWVAFEREPGTAPAPALDDRNPGSITRLLAEAFAREYAVVSKQLELVYDAAFVDTAGGRDLDAVAALVGVRRRGQTTARGEVTFLRATPAAADITVPVGSRVSTAEPPLVTVETTETVTLRRGVQAATAPVRSLTEGPTGVAAARTLTVLHRPILGIEQVTNPEPLTFGGEAERDAELRLRVTRALEGSGRSTVGAIRGALASLEGVREQDVVLVEDHLAHPGVVKLTVTADLDAAAAIAASRLLEEHRPAGVRIVHNLPAPTATAPTLDGEPRGGGEGPSSAGDVLEGVWFPVVAAVTVTPASTQLTSQQRDRLAVDVATALQGAVDAAGAGEPLVYNRLVAAVMAVEGVLDAVIDVQPGPLEAGTVVAGRVNLRPPPGTRVRLDPADLTVTLRGALVALDVSAEVQRIGLAASAEAISALEAAEDDIERRLVEALQVAPDVITPAYLKGQLPDTADYRVTAVSYQAELIEEGLRVVRPDVTIDLAGDQQPWIRSVSVTEAVIG